MPPSDDRLQDLRRQRTLVQEQLAWLDREIAAATGAAAPQPPAPSLVPQNPPAAAAPAPADQDVEAILESYRAEVSAGPADARRGCYMVFFAGLALFALVVLGWYFYTVHRQPPAH
ncbi:MAG TPA: hypothetical protein VK717_08035 [Opitutaceae bacterium]|jgi:hypothetical protein|nr:hypothetical protein [Opitutaceae bacterium]